MYRVCSISSLKRRGHYWVGTSGPREKSHEISSIVEHIHFKDKVTPSKVYLNLNAKTNSALGENSLILGPVRVTQAPEARKAEGVD
jgi:hypothetical protein